MPGPSLYFPDGIPPNVERLVSPDVIHRLVQKGLKDVARKWEGLSATAASIASGYRPWWRRIFQGKTDIESKYLLALLYLPPQKWPKGLSGEEKDLLNLLRRVRDLENAGVIDRYAAILNQANAGFSLSVFVQVTLERQIETALDTFERIIADRPEVMEAYLMTGYSEYLLRIVVPGVPEYESFLKDHLTRIPGVASIKSSFALNRVKYETALPLRTD